MLSFWSTYEFHSKVNPHNNLFSSLLSFLLPQVFSLPLGSLTGLDPPACRCCAEKKKKKKSEKLGSKSNNTRSSISVSLRYPSLQVLHSVWNRFPACGEFAPLLALLCRHMLGFMMPLDARSASSPSLTYWTNLHLMFFCFSLFALQSTYLTHSVRGQLCGYNNKMPVPRKFLHASWETLIYYWTLSYKSVQLLSKKVFFSCLLLLWCDSVQLMQYRT